MKLDAARRYKNEETVDAVVIGTGAGGAPLTARLAQAGLRVVALEAGRNWEPAEHTADEVEAGDIYWLGERLSDGGTPIAFGGNNSGTGVGGSMLHWGAFTPRPDRRDLKLATESGAGADWPIELNELTPYLLEVERFIGVSGPSPYPWDPERRYTLPPVAINAPGHAMRRGCAELGIKTAAAPAAVLTRDRPAGDGPSRQACVQCGACHQGCRNGAKAGTDLTYLPAAMAAGAEIRPGCMVIDLERDGGGRITAVVYRFEGRDYRQRCSAVFLCAGGVETPRLLLHLGIANSSGQVGRNLMAHVATQVWGTFPVEMRCNRGYPSSVISEDMMRPAGADFAGGYLLQSLGVLPVTWATNLTRGRGLWGRALVEAIDGYNYVAGLGINGDCLPDDGNLLTLCDESDEFGIPKAKTHFTFGANERAMDKHAVATMTAIWQEAGARDIYAVPRNAHTIGTCRMGHDREQAVINGAGQSFDIPNLFICDNSIFPSALAANPALTIMALSLRTADKFLAGRPEA